MAEQVRKPLRENDVFMDIASSFWSLATQENILRATVCGFFSLRQSAPICGAPQEGAV
jgi:hypothetical protein